MSNKMNFKQAKKLKKDLKKSVPDGAFDIVIHKNGHFYVIDFLVENDIYRLIDCFKADFDCNNKDFIILKKQK